MTFHWPQLTWLFLACLSVGLDMERHGQPKKGTHNFWTSVISVALTMFLLYKGGFFG